MMATAALRAARFVLSLIAIAGLVATVLPAGSTDACWIRNLDYLRLQFTLVMLVALVAVVVLPGRTRKTW